MVKHDWTIIAVRTCTVCDGTGKNPPAARSGQGQQSYSQGPRPTECPTCGGEGKEKKPYTLAELAAELRSLAP
jgi:DnaJ-class molecular chaperone